MAVVSPWFKLYGLIHHFLLTSMLKNTKKDVIKTLRCLESNGRDPYDMLKLQFN